MSDNDLKNPEEAKRDHEHYDPLEKLKQIFNSNLENEKKNAQHAQSLLKSEHSVPQVSEDSSSFNLPFLEDINENNLGGELPFDDNEQWNAQLNTNNQNHMDMVKNFAVNRSNQNIFFSKAEYSPHINSNEEKFLNTLSPLPIPNAQAIGNRSDPVNISSSSEEGNFNPKIRNSFPDGLDPRSSDIFTAALHKETDPPSPVNVQQTEVYSTQPEYNYQKNTYKTSVNYSYEIPTSQQNIAPTNEHTLLSSSNKTSNINSTAINELTNIASTVNSSQTDKFVNLEDFSQEKHIINVPEKQNLKQESNIAKTSVYNNAQIQYTRNDIHNTQDISKNNEQKKQYNQNDFNYTSPPLGTFDNGQMGSFSMENLTHSDNSPPNVDTYKFAEEIVEKTEPVMVSAVSYEEPKYDVPLEKEFSDVFSIGNTITENFSQKQRSEAFYPAKQNLMTDLNINTQEKNTNYSSTENGKLYSSSFPENSQYGYANETPTSTLTDSSLKSFTIGRLLTKSIIFLILATIGLVSYIYFFISSDRNEDLNIIRADNTPFKVKPEITESENNITHNLDIYKQITEKNTKQENTQQFLFDNSEAPENLTELNKKVTESSSSSPLDEAYVEDAIAAALNHIIPTQEVNTVVVKSDGTIVKTSNDHTDEKTVAQYEITNNVIPEQSQKQLSVSSQSSATKKNETEQSFTDREKTKHTLITDSSYVATENNSVSSIKEKMRDSFIPVPSPSHLNSKAPIPNSSNLDSSRQTTMQNGERYYVQLSSQPTPELAQNSLRKIKSKFGSVIGSRSLNIQSALISGKGTYYRIRVQTQNRDEAVSLCEAIRQSGGSCFITN
ncbi:MULTISPECIES: SPOR domain-containing protein [unclassified Bartonella]|uniref:SPOR domain-containing protein n=1 Tax=unclassified Bartonella TaxID=2645622 RepID=UPI00099A8C5E|nr:MULTISPECIES: SPOR domain-containing protein [unclassified Bartonella]AQX27922.1 Sporulation related domain-containing protein [Bartonella sp. JB15]AQX29201.1 Sporulation related domain-containing protein [Bartonella sp. JB63]